MGTERAGGTPRKLYDNMFGFQRLANRQSWDFSTVEKMPMATVALSGEMFPTRDDISDVYKPLMQFFPAADRVAHPDAHGLEIISTWKGLSIAQAHEVGFWENVFRRTLENAVRDALLTEFERSIQFLGSAAPPNAAHEFYAYINRLDEKEFQFQPSELIRSMIECHTVAGSQHTWLYSPSHFEFFQHLLHFLGTRECFKSGGAMCTVTVLHIRAYPPKMTLQGEYMVNVMGKVLWEPLRTIFPDLPRSIEVGSSCRINLVIEAPDFIEFTGASAQYATVCKHKIISGDFDVFWNHVTNSFEGIVPSYSSRKPWLGEWSTNEAAGMQRLEFRIMSIYDDLFPNGVRLERELQSRIAINASERRPSPALESQSQSLRKTFARRLHRTDSFISSASDSSFSPIFTTESNVTRPGRLRNAGRNDSMANATGSTVIANMHPPREVSAIFRMPLGGPGMHVPAPTHRAPFQSMTNKVRRRVPETGSKRISIDDFLCDEDSLASEEPSEVSDYGTTTTRSIPAFDHHFKNRIRKDFPTLVSARGDAAFGPSRPPTSPSKRQTSWVASYDTTPASKVGHDSDLDSAEMIYSGSPLKRMRPDGGCTEINRNQGTLRRREHRPLAQNADRQNRLEGIVRRVVKDELQSLTVTPQSIIVGQGENVPPARDLLDADPDSFYPTPGNVARLSLEVSAGEGYVDATPIPRTPRSAQSNISTGMDLDMSAITKDSTIRPNVGSRTIVRDSEASSSHKGQVLQPMRKGKTRNGLFVDLDLGPPALPAEDTNSGLPAHPGPSPGLEKHIAAVQRQIGENYDEALARSTFRSENGYDLDELHDAEIANAFLCDPEEGDGADDARMWDGEELLIYSEDGK